MDSPTVKLQYRRCEPMQVEYLATMSLPDDGWDVNMLE